MQKLNKVAKLDQILEDETKIPRGLLYISINCFCISTIS